MGSRLELQAVLEAIVEPVYFQAPTGTEMQYPCVLYERDQSHTVFADNRPYSRTKRYLVTVVDRNPDSELPDLVEALPLCTFSRAFETENLHHWVFTLFF